MNTTTRISVWSGPRNVSTALMYSFAQRGDTHVVDEPLYAYYLLKSGADHPGREEILGSMEHELPKLTQQLGSGDYGKPVLFLKNMAHHLYDTSLDLLDDYLNVLLIRDPAEVINSYIRTRPNPEMRDLGFDLLFKIYESLCAKGREPWVLDARQILLNSEKVLRQLCEGIGIGFDPKMLSWKKGPRPEDGIWAKYWYENVHNSTGFSPIGQNAAPVPKRLMEVWRECNIFYSELQSKTIMA